VASSLLTLAIETSCDETSVAVLHGEREVLVNLVSSQAELHREYGGVVPELAARRHLETLNPLIEEALAESGVGLGQIGLVAVTIGPGLVVALVIGLAAAKSLAYALDVPLVGVNHLEGHVYANLLAYPEVKLPLIVLVVSGGHTLLTVLDEQGDFRTLGETLDDATGEAFDKVAAYLDLGYPGGPVIDRLAKSGSPDAYALPRALLRRRDYDFSLSGVKTAVIYLVEELRRQKEEFSIPDLCASFQAAVFEVQVEKAFRASRELGVPRLALAGGVAANSYLRARFEERSAAEGKEFYSPPPALCTDNAAMIATLGYYHAGNKRPEADPYSLEPEPGLSM